MRDNKENGNFWISPDGHANNIGDAKHLDWIAARLNKKKSPECIDEALALGWVRVSSSSFGNLPANFRGKASLHGRSNNRLNRPDLNVIINYGSHAPLSAGVLESIGRILAHIDGYYSTVNYAVEISTPGTSATQYSEIFTEPPHAMRFIRDHQSQPGVVCTHPTENEKLSYPLDKYREA